MVKVAVFFLVGFSGSFGITRSLARSVARSRTGRSAGRSRFARYFFVGGLGAAFIDRPPPLATALVDGVGAAPLLLWTKQLELVWDKFCSSNRNVYNVDLFSLDAPTPPTPYGGEYDSMQLPLLFFRRRSFWSATTSAMAVRGEGEGGAASLPRDR